MKQWKHICLKWNEFIKRILRKESIFKRLNLSFLGLLLGAAAFITFFSFDKYSKEIIWNLKQNAAMQVQNICLKMEDIMREYEDVALQFYDDARVLQAAVENAEADQNGEKGKEDNIALIEEKLYTMSRQRKHIKNVQFVTPGRQYHMMEENGYRRGGTIRNLTEFYNKTYYQEPQEKHGYPVWFEDAGQSETFYENEQSVYGFGSIVTLGVAVYNPYTREFLGVLFININIEAFEAAADGYEGGPEGNMFLTGKDSVVQGFAPSIYAPSFPKDKTIFEDMKEKQKDSVRKRIEERDVLFAYENIPGTDMSVVYLGNMDRLLEGTYQTRNVCIFVLICVVLACFTVSYYVTCSISDPIRQLIKVMDKAGKGKWTVRYPISGNDEITVLGERFNDMADRTNQLIEQVYLSEIRRQKLQLSWKNAQLDAMLMQINPHFLYNTLDIIRWEAMYEANGESRVTRMIEQFSKLCRMGMRTGGNTIPLSEGLEHAKVYLEVINFRHQDKIELSVSIKPDVRDCYIPQFMLQPIMENAVVHGFNDAAKGCQIEILVTNWEEKLKIVVKDNGKGMTEEEQKQLQKQIDEEIQSGKNIGMANVNQRIRLFYGEEYGIQMESRQGEGTEVEIILPIRKYSENMKNLSGEEKEDDLSGSDCR